jgi:hypothetical protein
MPANAATTSPFPQTQERFSTTTVKQPEAALVLVRRRVLPAVSNASNSNEFAWYYGRKAANSVNAARLYEWKHKGQPARRKKKVAGTIRSAN